MSHLKKERRHCKLSTVWFALSQYLQQQKIWLGNDFSTDVGTENKGYIFTH